VARPEITGRKLRQGVETQVEVPPIRGPPAPVAMAAYTIKEFCFAHRISVDHYFKQQRKGLGPRVMRVGSRSLISFESARAWRHAREVAAEEAVEKQRV
jgi:hypothetical protein